MTDETRNVRNDMNETTKILLICAICLIVMFLCGYAGYRLRQSHEQTSVIRDTVLIRPEIAQIPTPVTHRDTVWVNVPSPSKVPSEGEYKPIPAIPTIKYRFADSVTVRDTVLIASEDTSFVVPRKVFLSGEFWTPTNEFANIGYRANPISVVYDRPKFSYTINKAPDFWVQLSALNRGGQIGFGYHGLGFTGGLIQVEAKSYSLWGIIWHHGF